MSFADGRDKLHLWFGLSYAGFLVLPRVLIQEMPLEWKNKLADLLEEYDNAYPNRPEIGVRVLATTLAGKLCKMPKWLIRYRRPDQAMIQWSRGERTTESSDRNVQ
jgi:hypothetical protein